MSRPSIGHKLELFCLEWRENPFDWEHNNCAHMAARWIVFLREQEECIVLPQVASRQEARRLFIEYQSNFESLVELLPHLTSRPVNLVTQGDIVLVQMEDHDFVALGIYLGPHCIMLNDDGSLRKQIMPIRAAWSIQHGT